MQTGGWLVKQVNSSTSTALCKFRSKFHALRLSAGQRWCRLPQSNVPKANIKQGLHVSTNPRLIGEEINGFGYRHVQNLRNILALEQNV